ncbi:MAG: two-component regulator propeller domain-containing protein [Bacteroidales bacterium]
MRSRISRINGWWSNYRLPARFIFIVTGVLSTAWFLVRVIPKPSRAGYPCMRIAAPVMSGFVVYLLTMAGFAVMIRKARGHFLRARYMTAGFLVMAAFLVMAFFIGRNSNVSFASQLEKTGPDDGPNQAIGTGQGVHPGRVVWVWDPRATNENCINVFDFPKPENTNQGIVNRMVVEGIRNLGGNENLSESWDAIFRSFNYKKSGTDRTYSRGEKIFIKINQGTSIHMLKTIDEKTGFDVPKKYSESKGAEEGKYGACETFPAVALEILRELVYVVGVDEKDIAIGDPIGHIFDYNYQAWFSEFPEVVYLDKVSALYGRTLIRPTENDLVFYSDKTQSDRLFDVIENADYLINLANLKPHGSAGVSLTAKNHFGSQARKTAAHLHYSLIAPFSQGNPTNAGYHKYRVLVDLMGSKYLGQNTLLYVVDGLYGGGSIETKVPVKYFMPPFNNDWSNSIFLSQDQVALESVCYDFLRTEWNGTYEHNPANNSLESMANANGVDDYLHQAADPANWPDGILYDPDRSGTALASLGTHEHWNNAAKKQYSRNLGRSEGIELISVPDTLVGGDGPEITTSGQWHKATQAPEENLSLPVDVPENEPARPSDPKGSEKFVVRSVIPLTFEGAFTARKFYSVVVDNDNVKWFLSDAGIVSFDGEQWNIHNENRKIPNADLKGMAFDSSEFGNELWLASPLGATVASIPLDARSGATTYYSENSAIASENVFSVAVGKGSLRWFGTDKGISAFHGDLWLTPAYQRKYPEYMFQDFPITSMATSPDGELLYVATKGAGVTRVFRNDVDAISGASEYAQWGPIEIPSDHINCICIAPDGTQWFGTDKGVARHVGNETLDNWLALDREDGLIDNFVQSIAMDHQGNVWIGTKGGVSIYDNHTLRSMTWEDGLTSNNVLCISVDKEGVVWLGTDRGVTSYSAEEVSRYTN